MILGGSMKAGAGTAAVLIGLDNGSWRWKVLTGESVTRAGAETGTGLGCLQDIKTFFLFQSHAGRLRLEGLAFEG